MSEEVFRELRENWHGYLVAFFALIWVANQYMSIYNHLRLDIKHEQVEIRARESRMPGGLGDSQTRTSRVEVLPNRRHDAR